MGQLAHYTADLANPFHLTRDYDGQSTGQSGIHHRYEEGLVERFEGNLVVSLWGRRGGSPPAADDPLAAAFGLMAGAGAEVRHALDADLRASQCCGLETDRYWKEMWTALASPLTEQLTRGALLTAAIWQGAYERAGSPVLDADAPALGPR